jgi:glycosyltransferase involved in cell wall biosynthesis
VRVLFYDDAAEFGGHETMTLAAVRHIASQSDMAVGFMHFHGNLRLARQIAELAAEYPNLTPMPQEYASRALQFLRTLISWRAIGRIDRTMEAFAPDIVVVAQGAIAFGSVALIAAKRAGLPTISYIPMTHPERLFSASRWKAAVREPVNRIYYRLPDEYITISPRMKDYLMRKGLRQRVTLVKVAIDLTKTSLVDKATARARWGLSMDDWVVGMVGRVQFWQKRQDLAVSGLALARKKIPRLKLLLVGDGPDLAALKALVADEGLEDSVIFAGWTDGLSPVYSAIDVLAIPSRFEGVPLVLLEALYFRLPVVASGVDGMMDMLPPHWLFPTGDAAAFAARLVEFAQADERLLLDHHRARVVEDHSMPAFEREFLGALVAAIQRLGRKRSAARVRDCGA